MTEESNKKERMRVIAERWRKNNPERFKAMVRRSRIKIGIARAEQGHSPNTGKKPKDNHTRDLYKRWASEMSVKFEKGERCLFYLEWLTKTKSKERTAARAKREKHLPPLVKSGNPNHPEYAEFAELFANIRRGVDNELIPLPLKNRDLFVSWAEKGQEALDTPDTLVPTFRHFVVMHNLEKRIQHLHNPELKKRDKNCFSQAHIIRLKKCLEMAALGRSCNGNIPSEDSVPILKEWAKRYSRAFSVGEAIPTIQAFKRMLLLERGWPDENCGPERLRRRMSYRAMQNSVALAELRGVKGNTRNKKYLAKYKKAFEQDRFFPALARS